ncbi:MAG: site-specific integrase [Porticoccaceae bacterium]|nr:site-specific integrase [Porticoccaceae bacterium]
MKLRKPFSILITSLSFVTSYSAFSDQVVLKNGDILHGVIKTQTEAYISWESDNFGIFKIPKLQIASIEYSDTNPSGITEATAKDKIIYSGSMGISGSYLSGNENRDDLEVMDRVPKMKMMKEKQRELFLMPKQVRKLMLFLDELRADMVEFGANTGLRNTNVRMLEWTQLASNLSTLTIKGKDSKNGEPNIISLSGDAQRVLRRQYAKKLYMEEAYPELKGRIKYVFIQESRSKRSNGKPFAASSVTNETWRKAVERAGLPKEVVFHTMRHTFASWHLENGSDPKVVQELGNWMDPRSMDRYRHVNQKQKALAANNINGMLRSDG